jgi:hypothetical protein
MTLRYKRIANFLIKIFKKMAKKNIFGQKFGPRLGEIYRAPQLRDWLFDCHFLPVFGQFNMKRKAPDHLVNVAFLQITGKQNYLHPLVPKSTRPHNPNVIFYVFSFPFRYEIWTKE